MQMVGSTNTRGKQDALDDILDSDGSVSCALEKTFWKFCDIHLQKEYWAFRVSVCTQQIEEFVEQVWS